LLLQLTNGRLQQAQRTTSCN